MLLLNNKFNTFLNREGPFICPNIVGGHVLEAQFGGNLLEKSVFLASKLGDGHLLEHGPLRDFLW